MDNSDIWKATARLIFKQGVKGAKKIGDQGRSQMELRSIHKKRQKLYTKLGKEVELLMQRGELTHPGLDRAFQKLQEVHQELEQKT